MGKPKAPAFQLYAGDFLTDTMAWTDEQVGAHCRLLFWSWANRQGVPKDVEQLDMISRTATRHWAIIGTKWTEGPNDTWINTRLEKTREESDAFRERQKAKSAKAWASRSAEPVEHPAEEPSDIPVGKPMDASTGNPLEGEEEDSVLTQGRKERAKQELQWPSFAGPNVKAKWREFVLYRISEKKSRYKSVATEQRALNLAAAYFPSGRMFVEALDHAMAKTWSFPVDPTEYKYPFSADAKPQPVSTIKPWIA